MIKLQDFAKQQGVTDRAIQKHLKKYEAELEGLFVRKGPNGTWLTDEACEILRSKMKQQPITVFEEDPRIGQMAERIKMLEEQLAVANTLVTTSQQQVQVAQEKVAQLQEAEKVIARLEASNESVEQQRKQTEEQNALLKAQNADLSAEKEAERVKALEAEKNAQKATQELLDARKEFEDKEHLMQQEIEQLRGRKWYQLLFKKNKG